MGFRVNRRISLGKNVRVNIGKRGVSTSVKMGPVTVNSRGRKTVHVAKGVSIPSIRRRKETPLRSGGQLSRAINRRVILPHLQAARHISPAQRL